MMKQSLVNLFLLRLLFDSVAELTFFYLNLSQMNQFAMTQKMTNYASDFYS